MWGLASSACWSQASTIPVWCPSSKISSSYSKPAVESCSKTTSMLCDPKSQFMTPNLDFWFVLHHARGWDWVRFEDPFQPKLFHDSGGVSVEPSCLLCGQGLSLSQSSESWLRGALGCHQYSQ